MRPARLLVTRRPKGLGKFFIFSGKVSRLPATSRPSSLPLSTTFSDVVRKLGLLTGLNFQLSPAK